MPEGNKLSVAVLDVVAHHYSVRVALKLTLPFSGSPDFEKMVSYPEIRCFCRHKVVVYPHLIIEESLTDIADIITNFPLLEDTFSQNIPLKGDNFN